MLLPVKMASFPTTNQSPTHPYYLIHLLCGGDIVDKIQDIVHTSNKAMNKTYNVEPALYDSSGSMILDLKFK